MKEGYQKMKKFGSSSLVVEYTTVARMARVRFSPAALKINYGGKKCIVKNFMMY